MTLEQRKFSAVPDRLRPVGNVPLSDADRRPMTSKQAKKLHLERNRGPRLTKQQQRERDRDLQAEIRREIAEKEKAERQEKDRVRQQAKARVLRDKKKAKEDAEKDAKRKAGLPLATCRPSQDTIARFFKSNRVEKKTSISGLDQREHEEPMIPRCQAEEARPGSSQSYGEQQHVESPAAPTEVAKLQTPTQLKHSAVPSTELLRLPAIREQEELTDKGNDTDDEPSAAPSYTELQKEAQLEVPRSPPKKRIRLDKEADDQACSPPLIIQRIPSPSRPSSASISPARNMALQHDRPLADSAYSTVPALDCVQDRIHASHSPPVKVPGTEAVTNRLSRDQINRPGFIRASALRETPKHRAVPRFVRPPHPSAYKDRQSRPDTGSGSRKFLQPVTERVLCKDSPSIPPPSSTLAFINDNLDDFFGDCSQLALEGAITEKGGNVQTDKLSSQSRKRPGEAAPLDVCKKGRPSPAVAPVVNLLPEFGDLDSLFPSGTQLQRELLEDQVVSSVHDVGAKPAVRGETIQRAGSDGAPASTKKQCPKQNRLTLLQADAGDAMPFFCSQDFNLSPQDMQEIESPPVTVAKTARRDTPERMGHQAEQAAPWIPMTWKRRRPVLQSFATGRTRHSKGMMQKPRPDPSQRANARAPQNVLEIHHPEPPAVVNASDHPATTGQRAPLRPISNPPDAAQPPQQAVSSQDLAAMLEADWDDDCLQAQHRQQEHEKEPRKPRPESSEPQDLWDAISSQDLRAVFAEEDWSNLAV
ncbi:uncharacterized protein VDAG_09661 [Verticillium dahliae VdLs.17]|uniref:Uncharacterized protein n=2 Tax=Verticillium dahliae TaxID=27337 RepID=G2XI11_VERDV|nr:uncharacterized protein VDAG_09661 [Verticillium dahliae VdLs.17]EGY19459.1 hypothetical protein VDAG_09661 [Verticillium dahliae VdLs.17]KAF3351763.1 Delta(12) fatty acid desaturase [Verticillium dahliae VDG2]PNH29335.1 hypothetical protein BJF96_g7388 [Verticillium dahliae]PNH51262.1 hypothetical protein VD0003_g5965 [Verticillium dahliae]